MLTITRIQQLELCRLDRLRAESLADGHKFIDRLCEDWNSGANRFDAPGEALFLALIDCEVVGVCGLNRDPYLGDPSIGRVRRLYVMKSYRREGIGRALVETVITCAIRPFRVLRVRTNAASEFYLALGFRLITSNPNTTHVLDLTPTAFAT